MKLSTAFASTLLALAAHGAEADTRIGVICTSRACPTTSGTPQNGVYQSNTDAFGNVIVRTPTEAYTIDRMTGEKRPLNGNGYPRDLSSTMGFQPMFPQNRMGGVNGANRIQRQPLDNRVPDNRVQFPPQITSPSLSLRDQYIAGYATMEPEPETMGNAAPNMFVMKSARGEINCHESVLDSTIERDLNKLCGVDETPPHPGERISSIAVWNVIDNPYKYYKAISKLTEAFCKQPTAKPQPKRSVIAAGEPSECIIVERFAHKPQR